VHVFEASLNGAEYVAKCLNLGDHYESRKFAEAVHLMLSPAFFKVMKAKGRLGKEAFSNGGKTGQRAGTGLDQRP